MNDRNVPLFNGVKRADRFTGQAGFASGYIDLRYKSGGCDHWNAVEMSLHGTAAAGTAVSYRIKTSQHGILEKRMVHMPPVMLCFENIESLFLRYPSGPQRMMCDDAAGKGFTDYQAYIQGKTGVVPCSTAGAVKHCYMFRMSHDDIPCPSV